MKPLGVGWFVRYIISTINCHKPKSYPIFETQLSYLLRKILDLGGQQIHVSYRFSLSRTKFAGTATPGRCPRRSGASLRHKSTFLRRWGGVPFDFQGQGIEHGVFKPLKMGLKACVYIYIYVYIYISWKLALLVCCRHKYLHACFGDLTKHARSLEFGALHFQTNPPKWGYTGYTYT